MIVLLLAIIVVFASANVLKDIGSDFDIEHTRVQRSAAKDRGYDRGHYKGVQYNEGYNKKGYHKGGNGYHKGGHYKGGHHGELSVNAINYCAMMNSKSVRKCSLM